MSQNRVLQDRLRTRLDRWRYSAGWKPETMSSRTSLCRELQIQLGHSNDEGLNSFQSLLQVADKVTNNYLPLSGTTARIVSPIRYTEHNRWPISHDGFTSLARLVSAVQNYCPSPLLLHVGRSGRGYIGSGLMHFALGRRAIRFCQTSKDRLVFCVRASECVYTSAFTPPIRPRSAFLFRILSVNFEFSRRSLLHT